MISLLLVFFVICLCVLREVLAKIQNKSPPGPFQWPLIGNVLLMKKLSKQYGGMHVALQYLAKKYKTSVLSLKLGSENTIVVFGKDTVQKVLFSDDFIGRPRNFFLTLRCFESINGITCTDGEFWQQQRHFLTRNLRTLGFGRTQMNHEIEFESFKILSELENRLINNRIEKIDLKHILARSVFNILWIIVTGTKITATNENKFNEFFDLMDQRSRAFDMSGGLLNHFPFLRFICPDFVGYTLIKSLNGKLKKYIDDIIDEHQSDSKNDLISLYLSEIERGTQHFNHDQMRLVIFDLFIAGSQTTTNTLRFALLMMAIHGDIQNNVFKELRNVFKDAKDIQYLSKSKTPYTEAVISESMRINHVTPIIGPRRALKDTMLDDYLVKKDTTVLISIDSIHKDNDIWKNSTEFLPERFLHKETDRIIPFGLGKRRCLGDALARNCIYTMFAAILYNFQLEPEKGYNLSTTPVPGITLSPQNYYLRLKKRL